MSVYAVCPFCDGSASSIGPLGNREWFQCRQCGCRHSLPHSTVVEESEQRNTRARTSAREDS